MNLSKISNCLQFPILPDSRMHVTQQFDCGKFRMHFNCLLIKSNTIILFVMHCLVPPFSISLNGRNTWFRADLCCLSLSTGCFRFNFKWVDVILLLSKILLSKLLKGLAKLSMDFFTLKDGCFSFSFVKSIFTEVLRIFGESFDFFLVNTLLNENWIPDFSEVSEISFFTENKSSISDSSLRGFSWKNTLTYRTAYRGSGFYLMIG